MQEAYLRNTFKEAYSITIYNQLKYDNNKVLSDDSGSFKVPSGFSSPLPKSGGGGTSRSATKQRLRPHRKHPEMHFGFHLLCFVHGRGCSQPFPTHFCFLLCPNLYCPHRPRHQDKGKGPEGCVSVGRSLRERQPAPLVFGCSRRGAQTRAAGGTVPCVLLCTSTHLQHSSIRSCRQPPAPAARDQSLSLAGTQPQAGGQDSLKGGPSPQAPPSGPQASLAHSEAAAEGGWGGGWGVGFPRRPVRQGRSQDRRSL